MSERINYIWYSSGAAYPVFQRETIPAASAENEGKIFQYIGTTDTNYTNGYFYKCEEVGGSYEWQRVNVQPSGSAATGAVVYNESQQLTDSQKAQARSNINAQVVVQVSSIPTASVDYVGNVYQYIGATDANYTNGYFYKCVSDGAETPTYSWSRIDVQPDNSPSIDIYQTTGQSTTGVMSQKATTDELNLRAKTDGVYEQMVVGLSQNIVGRGSVEATYSRRFTGATDVGAGVARIKKLKGNAMVWNQLVGSSTTSVTIPSGRKYFFQNTTNSSESIATSDGNAVSVVGGSDMIIDLTLMFGAGKEPASVAEFKALFPNGLYDYNAGQIVGFNSTGIKTDGFNQWDEQWEVGKYNDSTGEFITGGSNNRVCSNHLNRIAVFPNTAYYFNAPAGITIIWYDSNGTCLNPTLSTGEKWLGSGKGVITSPAQAAAISFYMVADYGQVYKDDICINISHSGILNGENDRHWDATMALNVSAMKANNVAIFPEGMLSARDAYDEAVVDADGYCRKVIKRIGKVDLGTLSYSKFPAQDEHYRFQSSAFSVAAKNGRNLLVSNGIQPTTSTFSNEGIMTEGNVVYIRSNNYDTLDANAFKAAMSGVYLYYELATPVEYTLDTPILMRYREDDWGTESVLPQNTSASVTTTPIKMDVQYPLNAADSIRNLPKNYAGIAASGTASTIGNLLEALKTAGIVATYSITWDANNQRYNFSITKQA